MGELHEQILKNKLSEFEGKNKRVLHLSRGYRPDGLVIDFDNKKVIAIEVEMETKNYKRYISNYRRDYKKSERNGIDEVIVFVPVLPFSKLKFRPSLLEKIKELKSKGLTYKEIARRLNMHEVTIKRMIYGGIGSSYLKVLNKLKERNIIVKDFKGVEFGKEPWDYPAKTV